MPCPACSSSRQAAAAAGSEGSAAFSLSSVAGPQGSHAAMRSALTHHNPPPLPVLFPSQNNPVPQRKPTWRSCSSRSLACSSSASSPSGRSPPAPLCQCSSRCLPPAPYTAAVMGQHSSTQGGMQRSAQQPRVQSGESAQQRLASASTAAAARPPCARPCRARRIPLHRHMPAQQRSCWP